MVDARVQRAPGLAVVGVGARASNGLTALQVAMMIRAGKSLPRESFLVDRRGEPIGVCRLASIGDEVMGDARLAALGAPALREAAMQAGASAPLVLALALAEGAQIALSPSRRARLLRAISEMAGVPIDAGRTVIVEQGRAGGAIALAIAEERITRGEDEVVVVGGIDSYFDADVLEALDDARRLHGASAENGFLPGEAAAFVAVTRRGRAAVGEIVGTAIAREPSPFGSAAPCQAQGVSAAIVQAVAAAGGGPLAWAITDVVSERHRVEEWLLASGRLHAAFAEGARHDQPLLVTGDVGAASVPLLVVLACVAFAAGHAPSPRALVVACSDGAARAALVVQRGERR